MRLILISNFSDILNEHYLLNLIFCEGLETYHLRKKNYSRDQMKAYIEKIPHYFHDRIVLHTHFDLINEYNLKGAHFTKAYTHEDFKLEYPDHPYDFQHLSFSLHSIQEIKQIGSAYNYIFLSPIFDSISNTGYNSKFRINDLKIFLADRDNRPEIIALSGITDSRIFNIHELGFDGLALLGHIWRHFEQDQQIIEAVNRFKKIKKLIQSAQEQQMKTA